MVCKHNVPGVDADRVYKPLSHLSFGERIDVAAFGEQFDSVVTMATRAELCELSVEALVVEQVVGVQVEELGKRCGGYLKRKWNNWGEGGGRVKRIRIIFLW